MKTTERIRRATFEDAENIASLIREANKDVAIRFNLNYQNAPKHPSFCNVEWIKEDFKKGVIYFIFEQSCIPVGCVAFESPDKDRAYLNRLSVIPSARRLGIGRELVDQHLGFSKENGISQISIGIIAAFTELKNWYLKLGFTEGPIKKFPHLPFDVRYMSIVL